MLENIAVIGLGYVGLPLACLCAKKGYRTIGYDTNRHTVSTLNLGKSHIRDETIESLLSDSMASGNFFPVSDVQKLEDCSIFLVCVPTPVNAHREPDMEPLIGAIHTISPYVKEGDLIVIESTVFPGTCEEVVAPLIEKATGFKCNGDVSLIHCPERVNPGDAFWTSENIPRVLGALDEAGAYRAAEFYSSILGGPVIDIGDVRSELRPKFSLTDSGELSVKQVPLGSVTIMRSIRDAEAVKAMENTVRDVNIAFVNELAKISDVLNLDVVDIIDGMSTKPFGKGPYYPGVGVGGHCIAVDPEWLKSASMKAGYMPELIQISRSTNDGMPAYTVSILEKLLVECNLSLDGASVAILGVAYKKNVDDLRESPYYQIKEILDQKRVTVSVFDSWVDRENTAITLKEAISGCEAIIIVTDHSDMLDELSKLDFSSYGVRVIVDGRNALDPNILPAGLLYRGIGKQ